MEQDLGMDDIAYLMNPKGYDVTFYDVAKKSEFKPSDIICMSHILELNEDKWTEILWKMQTESIVVFPEGIGVLEWILCGGDLIGDATAKKMANYRAVVWAQHGLFATGTSLDETFGLIETIEKAAEIYMKICDKKIVQSISNENLLEIAQAFHINFKHGIID